MAEPAALLQVLTADLGGGDAFGELVAAVITARLARAGWCDHDHLVAPALRQTLRGGWKGPGMGLDHESSRGASAVVVFEAVLISGLTQDFRGIGARIAVAADQHLTVLHDAIQEAFGWLDDHLYAFWLDGRFWSDDAVECTSPYTVDSPSQTAEVPIVTLELAVGAELAYVFDFGDEWRMRLTLQEQIEADGGPYPRVLGRTGTPRRSTRPTTRTERGTDVKRHADLVWRIAELLRGDFKQVHHDKVVPLPRKHREVHTCCALLDVGCSSAAVRRGGRPLAQDVRGCACRRTASTGGCPRRQVPSAAHDTLVVMRLLHTADWHLGRSFHGEGLLTAQAAWADWLVELAAAASVDAIVVAGDLYDRALPPVDAVALAGDALARLAAIAPVIVVAGNHDSATRLGFGSSLLSRAGLHLRTDAARSGEPVLVGELALYPIPYLEPDAVRTALGVEERGHGPVLTAAMELVRADLARRPGGTRAVVVAHAFVAGAQASGSERDLALGGAACVPASTFARADYVALGHLHGPQRVGENGRYAGSPLAFSFSEATHTKSVALVDLAAAAPTVELVGCPVPRPLARVRGTLEALLNDAVHEAAEEAWVEVTLTDAARPAEAMDRLRGRFPHAVALHFAPEGASPGAEGSYAARLRGLSDLALAASFVEEVRGVPADACEEALLAEVLGDPRVTERVA